MLKETVNTGLLRIDNDEYMVTNSKIIDGINYLLLINFNNPEEITIRKEIENNGQTYISKLDSDEEFNKVVVELCG